MEWEEALLIARGGELPLHPAAHYRRQAARARQIAVAVTTRAMKARLLDDAARYDELAAKADRYPLSPRIRTLREIRDKIRPEPVHEPLSQPRHYAPPRAGRYRRRP
jgi:hypothetical protein